MASLTSTNLSTAEMIPDTENPAHDPRFWCLPPVRDEPTVGGRARPYLVTQGKKVGVWYNWTVAKAAVSGYPAAAQRTHHSMAGCVAEWQPQQHCALGMHPHPAEPTCAIPALPATPALPLALPHLSVLGLGSQEDDEESLSSSPSGITTSTWEEIPETARFFAIWGGRIV
ncbi:hypothetical protein K438DRAFT_1986934 [Mycena galopus ATCC 62051]|nr:hypothetical protein K438DRAFT_1986934 [Mycena galopus ATCC 62051]